MSSPEAAATRRKTALVTGASSGIGAEIAFLLAEAGFDLVLASRRAKPGEPPIPAGVSVHHFSKDLGQPSAASELWTALSEAGIEVDVLVNNAGIGLYGPLATQD